MRNTSFIQILYGCGRRLRLFPRNVQQSGSSALYWLYRQWCSTFRMWDGKYCISKTFITRWKTFYYHARIAFNIALQGFSQLFQKPKCLQKISTQLIITTNICISTCTAGQRPPIILQLSRSVANCDQFIPKNFLISSSRLPFGRTLPRLPPIGINCP